MKFFEDILGLPRVWDCLHGKIPNLITENEENKNRKALRCTQQNPEKGYFNENGKRFSYQEYMNQLSEFEISLLYSAFFEDFEVFDYNPCASLSSSLVSVHS